MKDILERLLSRATHTFIIQGNPNLYYDAAHEIERLRAENETLRRDVRTAVMGDSAELQDVKRENEKLIGLLREAHVKMVENDLWVNLRQRVAAAIRESGE